MVASDVRTLSALEYSVHRRAGTTGPHRIASSSTAWCLRARQATQSREVIACSSASLENSEAGTDSTSATRSCCASAWKEGRWKSGTGWPAGITPNR